MKRPPYWDKLVSYAYLRMMGSTQAEGAKSAGRSLRCVKGWELDRPDLYRAAREEARDRWLTELDDAANRAILEGVKLGNTQLATWVKERVDPRFLPPRIRAEHSGPDGQPISTRLVVEFVEPDDADADG